MNQETTKIPSIPDISWNVSEAVYRQDPALSYSTIARFEREGFNGLPNLFNKIESPSLTFGSAVDALITGGIKEFDSKFFIADFPEITDSIIKIIQELFSRHKESYKSLDEIPDDAVSNVITEYKYQLNWKPETRIKVVREKGTEYYKFLYSSDGKTVINLATSEDAFRCKEALLSGPTKEFFCEDNPLDSIRRYYQLKFTDIVDGVPYRCMPDLLYVDYEHKVIVPVDLKTSSKPEWDFFKSFIEWNYFTQARLYWRIIRHNLDKSGFKDFELTNYKFVVVNRKTLTPIIWEFKHTKYVGDLTVTFENGSHHIIKDPYEVGKELFYYLNKYDWQGVTNGITPIGINKGNNVLEDWINIQES